MTISGEEMPTSTMSNIHEENNTYNFPENNTITNNNMTPIQSFYNDQVLFITGGTGFMGKIMLDKLLRSCPGIKTIYLLIRTKKGKNVEQRLNDLFNDSIFDLMKKQVPDFKDKIQIISGDCSLLNLGIQPEDRKKIVENTNVIFHCAATVRFDEKLPLAVAINVRGTKELIDMAHEMKNLKVFVHVSTAYSNSNLPEIEETFYKPGMSAENLIKLIDCAGDKLGEEIAPKVIGTWPNTYTFTKAVAEDLVRRNGKSLPMVLFRPAIVIGTSKEPVSGWIDNLYGPTGIVVGVGAGIIRCLHADPETVSDLVPVDLVVNAALASAWKRSQMKDIQDVPIFNYVSSHRNPINYGRFMELNMKYGRQVPSIKSVWCYTITLTKHRFLYELLAFTLHTLPAAIVDTGLFIVRKKPKALKIYKTISKFNDVLGYFSTRQWRFHDDNVVDLWQSISEKDKEIFQFDITQLDWDVFFKNNIDGLRLYMFKDDPSTLPEARKRMRKIEFAHVFIKYAVLGLVLYCLYLAFSLLF